jgi:VIT1/CCC1 family predicted Fe2+/Mn2+ transporter
MTPEHHHRDVRGGTARAAVFGLSDGLVSNVALILGVAGATSSAGVVRLAGMAGLIGGAFSMASGEYTSMRAQSELLERELELERIEIARRPENERRELVQIYRSRGLDVDLAEHLATEMHRDPQLALETHAREELGIDPAELGSPVGAAVSSFAAFAVGALLPLLPWLVATGDVAVIASVVIGGVAALAVGTALARFTGRPAPRLAVRQLLFAVVPAALTFALGNLIGIGTAAL